VPVGRAGALEPLKRGSVARLNGPALPTLSWAPGKGMGLPELPLSAAGQDDVREGLAEGALPGGAGQAEASGEPAAGPAQAAAAAAGRGDEEPPGIRHSPRPVPPARRSRAAAASGGAEQPSEAAVPRCWQFPVCMTLFHGTEDRPLPKPGC